MSASKKLRELNRAKIEHDKAQLSAQIENSKGVLNNIAESVLAQTIERQAAQIEMLRKMLKQVCGSYLLEHPDTNIDPFVEALSSTPEQALEQFAANVREQCAKVCENEYPHTVFHTDQRAAINCANAIRAIKELP